MAEGENEKELVGGLDIPLQLTHVEESIATLIRQFAQLKTTIGRIPIEFEATHGMGDQVQQVLDQTATKARFNWKAIARPEEFEAVLRSVEPQLNILAAQAEKAGSAIRMAVTGAAGTSQATITSQQDVAAAIEAMRTHGAAISGGGDIRAQMGMEFTPDQAGLSAAGDVSRAIAEADAVSRNRLEAAKDKRDLDEMTVKSAIKDLASEQGRTTFSAYGRPSEIQRYLQDVMPSLQPGEEAAHGQGQRLSYSLAGPRGSGFSTSQALNLQDFIQMIGQYAGSKEAFTAKVSMPSLGSDEDAKVQAHLGSLTNMTREQEASARASQKAAEQGEKLSKWLELWASGGRPQRAISEMLQGPMSAVAGAEGGAALAGLGGMIGGGMLFHAGWEIINQLGKIPARIAEQVELYRSYEMMRAGMMIPTTPAAQKAAPWDAKATLTNEQALDSVAAMYGAYAQRVRGGGAGPLEEFHTQLANLQRTGVDVSTPEKAEYWLRKNAQNLAMATVASEMNPTAFPKSYDFAYALQQMEVTKGAEGRSSLASNQALMPIFTAAFRQKFEWLGNADESVVRKAVTDALNKPETMGLTNIPTPGAIGHKDAITAVEQYLSGPQIVNMMRQKMATQTWSEWWNKTHLFYDPRGEMTDWQSEAVGALGKSMGRRYDKPLTDEQRAQEETKLANSLWSHEMSVFDALTPGATAAKQEEARRKAKELFPIAEAYSGLDPLSPLGLSGKQFEAPSIVGNAQFSFSSFSDFANKMQTEAGINLEDPARRTADAVEQMLEQQRETNRILRDSEDFGGDMGGGGGFGDADVNTAG